MPYQSAKGLQMRREDTMQDSTLGRHFRGRGAWALLVLIAGSDGCQTQQASPAALPVATRAVIAAQPGLLYRLVLRGVDTPTGLSLSPVNDTMLCCDGVRAGWIVLRGPHWVAVDTVAVNLSRDPNGTTFDGAGPYRVAVDSGLMERAARNIDLLLFRSLLSPAILPRPPASGTRRRDTLTITDRGPHDATRANVRVYVRTP